MSDCLEAVSLVNSHGVSFDVKGILAFEIQRLLVHLNVTEVSHCSRKGKIGARSIARFTLLNGGSFACLEDGPPWLMDYSNQDLYVISNSRDLGFMSSPSCIMHVTQLD